MNNDVLKSLVMAQQMQAQLQAQVHQTQLQLQISQLQPKAPVPQTALNQAQYIPQESALPNPPFHPPITPSHQTSQDLQEDSKKTHSTPTQSNTDPGTIYNISKRDSKQSKGRTKEEEDAGRTLLGFMSELRRNHDQAISASLPATTTIHSSSSETTRKSNPKSKLEKKRSLPIELSQHRKQSAVNIKDLNNGVDMTSAENEGAVITPASSVTRQSLSSMYSYPRARSDLTNNKDLETISSLSDTRSSSRYTESASSSGSQHDGSTASSEEEAEKLSSNLGPIRKRFKKNEFTSRNIGEHNSRIAKDDFVRRQTNTSLSGGRTHYVTPRTTSPQEGHAKKD